MALRDRFDGIRSGRGGLKWDNILNIVVRFLQIIMACVVIGYYASDLNAARKVQKYSDSKWVFAVVVGCMAAITALFLIIIGFFSHYTIVAYLFAWEWILFILWAAVTGLFGSMYFGENAEMDGGIESMKTAAAFDCVNLVLWFLTALVGTITFFLGRRRSLHTGRATL